MIYSQNVPCDVVYRILMASLFLTPASEIAISNEQGVFDQADSSIIITTEAGVENDRVQKSEMVFTPEIRIALSKFSRLTVIGRLRMDADKDIDPDKQIVSELRELYLETSIGRTLLTLGKQQIVWGKADGLKVLDVVNPQDFREFILDDFSESRIPLWSLNAEIPIKDATLQLLWLPDRTHHKFAKTNGSYAFTSTQIVPSVPSGVTLEVEDVEETDSRFKNSDWGFRLSTFWQGWDLTFNYLYYYVDTPVLFRQIRTTNTGTIATISPRYERSHLVGGTFSNAFGDFTVRGEMGYSMDRYFSTNNPDDADGVVKGNELGYVLGLDWYGLNDTLLSVQLFQTQLSESKPLMIRDKTNTTITALVKREFINDILSTQLLWLHNIDLDDGLFRPKVTYSINDEVKFWLGVDMFYGDQEGLFGQFNQRDRFLSGLEISI